MNDDKLTLRVQGLVLLGRIAHYTITCRDGQFGAAIESRQAETPGVNTASVWRYYETLDELLDSIGRNVVRWDVSSYLPGQEARPERVGAFLQGGVPWDTPATATPLEDFKAVPRPRGEPFGSGPSYPMSEANAQKLADELEKLRNGTVHVIPKSRPILDPLYRPDPAPLGRKGLFGVDGIPPLPSGEPGAPIPAESSPGSPDSCSQEPRHELLEAPGSPEPEPAPEPESPATGQIPDLAEASPEPPIRSPELAESKLGLHVEPCPRCGAQCDVEPSTAQVWCNEFCGYSYLRPDGARRFSTILAAHNRDCRDLRAMRRFRDVASDLSLPGATLNEALAVLRERLKEDR